MTTYLQPSPPASTNQPRGLLMSAIPALVKRLIPKFQEVGFAVGFACIHIRHKLPGHWTASNRWIQRPKLKCHSLAHGMRLLHIQCCSMNLQLTQSLSKAWKADDCYSANNNNRKSHHIHFSGAAYEGLITFEAAIALQCRRCTRRQCWPGAAEGELVLQAETGTGRFPPHAAA